MKRVLQILALSLLVVGVEVATGAISVALNRVTRVYLELTEGRDPGVSLGRFLTGVGMFVAGAGLLALDLWARAYGSFVVKGKTCPDCGAETERVKRRVRHRILGFVRGERVTRRKCKSCGWSGLAS